MKKNNLSLLLLVIFFLTLACTISYEGINFGSDPDIEFIEDQTATAASALTSTDKEATATTEPEYQPPQAQGSDAEQVHAGAHEYAVSAVNFECTCQVDGNVTTSFRFNGDQLEVTNPGGGVNVYDRIGDGAYKRTFMGYYILTSGSGAQATESIVEEERHVVILLNDEGYVMEHYQGSSTSPCCYHTFTRLK